MKEFSSIYLGISFYVSRIQNYISLQFRAKLLWNISPTSVRTRILIWTRIKRNVHSRLQNSFWLHVSSSLSFRSRLYSALECLTHEQRVKIALKMFRPVYSLTFLDLCFLYSVGVTDAICIDHVGNMIYQYERIFLYRVSLWSFPLFRIFGSYIWSINQFGSYAAFFYHPVSIVRIHSKFRKHFS